MKTTTEFLDAVKTKTGTQSDYAIAPILNVTRGAVSLWRNGKGTFDDETAEKVADLLGVSPVFVMACAHAERAKNPTVKKHWYEAAERFAAAMLIAFCVSLILPQEDDATTLSSASNDQQSIHYAK